MRLIAASTLVLALFAQALPSAAGEAEWSQWNGPERNGRSADAGLLKSWPEGGPKQLWQATGLGEGYSSAVVSNGIVYATGKVGEDLTLFAFDMNGQTKWKSPLAKEWSGSYPGTRSTPTVDDGMVYVLSGNGMLVCANAASGAKVWEVNICSTFGGRAGGWGFAESILILGNAAIVTPGGSRCVVAVNKKTGAQLWTSSGVSDPAGYGSPIAFKFEGATVIAQMTASALIGLDAASGALLFRETRCCGKTAVCPSPVYADGYVFGASGYGNGGACLKLSSAGGRVSAQKVWETAEMDCHHGGYIIHEGYIYGNHGGGWNCFDLKSGEKKWSARGPGKGSVCYADGMLYLFGEQGGQAMLAPVSPQGLTPAGTLRVQGNGPSWAHPVVTGGRLYLRYADNLYCFDVRDPNYKPPAAEKPKPSPAAEKPKPAEETPMPRAESRPLTDEEQARRLWNSATNFINNNATALAEKKLKELIEKYPDTEYGKQAAAKLKEISGANPPADK